jgi:hypothetical protein
VWATRVGYRRATDTERQQLKWFIRGAAPLFVLSAGSVVGVGLSLGARSRRGWAVPPRLAAHRTESVAGQPGMRSVRSSWLSSGSRASYQMR